MAASSKPNMIMIMADDVGIWNIRPQVISSI